MATATCGQCGASVPANEITHTLVGAYCRTCHMAEQADAAVLERKLVRSIGIRHLLVGIIMVVIGSVILALGLSGGSSFVVIPAGMLIGGVFEVGFGLSRINGKL